VPLPGGTPEASEAPQGPTIDTLLSGLGLANGTPLPPPPDRMPGPAPVSDNR
jgi:hypothetical protein